MKRIILLALCLTCIIGTASAYQLYLSCPESVQVGIPLKCSVDSNLPAGTTFDVVFYHSSTRRPQSTGKLLRSRNMQPTCLLPPYTCYLKRKVWRVTNTKLRPSLMVLRGQTLRRFRYMADYRTCDARENYDHFTSVQPFSEALRIEGSIKDLGDEGVQLESETDGRIFGPQYIGTKENQRDESGVFTQKVTVTVPGSMMSTLLMQPDLSVLRHSPCRLRQHHNDTRFYYRGCYYKTADNGSNPLPTTTQSPLSLLPVAAALTVVGLLAVSMAKDTRLVFFLKKIG